MTRISVALATYNGERFLREQLDSLARQTCLPDELVVADDGSTDRTLEIVRDFAVTAPFRVVVLPSRTRLGYRANFMRCAQHCEGDLIAFCDQDDVWDVDKLAVVSDTIAPSTLLLQHDFRVVDARLNVIDGNMHTIGLSTNQRWAPVLGLVQVFRRSLLPVWPLWTLSVDQNDARQPMAHDQWVYFVSQIHARVQNLEQPLLSYRQHDRNTCGLSRNAGASSRFRPGKILIETLRSRFLADGRKKEQILGGLRNCEAAASGRAAVISEIIKSAPLLDRSAGLQREANHYADLASYCHRRLVFHTARSRPRLVAALLDDRPDYLSRGWPGLKDFALDVIFAE